MTNQDEGKKEQAIEDIARNLANGEIAFFLGAGVNLCGREPNYFRPRENLPNGEELAKHLLQGYSLPAGSDYARNLARASEYAILRLKPLSFYGMLHEVFNVDFPPTPVHTLLANLPALCGHPQYFVTTNYDDVMERALAEAEQRFDVIWYDAAEKSPGQKAHGFWHLHLPDDVPYPTAGPSAASLEKYITRIENPTEYVDEIPFETRSVVFKVHGEVWRSKTYLDYDSYVITEDDYIDYLAFARQFPQGLVSELKKRNLLFLGYSLGDWNMRAFLAQVWQEQRLRVNSWAVLDRVDDLEQKIWEQRQVNFLIMNLEEFRYRLKRKLSPAAAPAGGSL